MAKNAAHIENFVSLNNTRFAIVDVTHNAISGTQYWEISSGSNQAQATKRFYERFVARGSHDKEMMINAQKNNRLSMHKIENNHRSLVEARLFLIV